MRQSENLFIAGLLHEIGHLVLYAKFPDLAHKTINTARENGLSIRQAEEQVIGMHYGQIGALLMSQWNLSEHLQEITSAQPTPQTDDQYARETALLHIAHAYAAQSVTDGELNLDELVDPAAWQISQITSQQVEDAMSGALETCNEMEQVIFNQP